jgi:site-specific recombinase XerD
MTSLAPVLQAFFTERLLTQRRVSPHTVASYRDTFRLLLIFAQQRTGKAPSRLDLADLDAPLIGAFLDDLEHGRRNSVRTRNARLVAIHSLFRYAALREPADAAVIQRVLAIPCKRFEKAIISFLTAAEAAAVLAAPDRGTWIGRRDHALLLTLFQTGLRVSELTGLRCQDVCLGKGAHLRCHGKGRKERATPLTSQTAAVLRSWMTELGGEPGSPLFPSRRRGPLSRDAVERLIGKYASAAARRCPSLRGKPISPHVFRHSTAMSLLGAGVDTSVIAIWLGHESVRSTDPYVHADMAIKQRALERMAPPGVPRGRYQPPDQLLAFLEDL